MSDVTPTSLTKVDEKTLGIEWSDGATSRYPVRFLRQQCPCAECVNEMTGERILDPESVDPNVEPVNIHPVGLYALTIEWSDKHSTGIYTFEHLRKLHDGLKSGEEG